MTKKGTTSNDYEAFLVGLSVTDLLSYKEMAEIMCDFYNNEMNASRGQYADDMEPIYTEAYDKFTRFLKAKNRVLAEIERRVEENLC